MSISKIELLENELEKNEAKIDLLQCECDKLWGELVEAQAKVRNITDIKNNLKNINEKINKKIIKLKKINNNIV
jgi:chromosome segregation ATPase